MLDVFEINEEYQIIFKSAEAKLELLARHLSWQLSHVTMIAGVR